MGLEVTVIPTVIKAESLEIVRSVSPEIFLDQIGERIAAVCGSYVSPVVKIAGDGSLFLRKRWRIVGEKIHVG
jgi:hypothetical protein